MPPVWSLENNGCMNILEASSIMRDSVVSNRGSLCLSRILETHPLLNLDCFASNKRILSPENVSYNFFFSNVWSSFDNFSKYSKADCSSL